MAGNTLTSASAMQCPHGGQVQVVPANTRARGDGLLLTRSDQFIVAGCPFTLPSGTPSPCLTVRWIPDGRVTAGGNATLSRSDTGLCLNPQQAPQGPVQITHTQSRVTSQ